MPKTLVRYTVSKTEANTHPWCFFALILTWASECKRPLGRPLSLQVRGFLIKKARFSGKIEGPKLLLESTGEGSQLAGTSPNTMIHLMRWRCLHRLICAIFSLCLLLVSMWICLVLLKGFVWYYLLISSSSLGSSNMIFLNCII